MFANYISEKRFLCPILKTFITTIKTQIINLKYGQKTWKATNNQKMFNDINYGTTTKIHFAANHFYGVKDSKTRKSFK